MNASNLRLECAPRNNYFDLSDKAIYNRRFVQNILTESFESQTGCPLPNHLFLEIWNKLDLSLTAVDPDVVYHIDTIYYDTIQKASFKYKKNGKHRRRIRNMCRFYFDDF